MVSPVKSASRCERLCGSRLSQHYFCVRMFISTVRRHFAQNQTIKNRLCANYHGRVMDTGDDLRHAHTDALAHNNCSTIKCQRQCLRCDTRNSRISQCSMNARRQWSVMVLLLEYTAAVRVPYQLRMSMTCLTIAIVAWVHLIDECTVNR